MRRTLALSAATAAALSTLVYAPSATAVTCTTLTHTDTAGVLTTTNGEPGGPSSGATLRLRQGGLEVALPDATSKALWLTPSPGLALSAVREVALRTRQHVPASVSMPSVQIQIDPDPTDLSVGAPHFTTLVYEPYQNGHAIPLDEPRTWSNLDGATKWWSTRTLPALPATSTPQGLVSWQSVLDAYPRATVLAWGWNVGKGAPGTRASLVYVQLGTAAGCARHVWAAPAVSPTPSASVTPSSSVTPSASVSATPSVSVSPSRSATPSASPSRSATPSASVSPRFASCVEAYAAGYENIGRTSPWYRPEFDSDDDGIACEASDLTTPSASDGLPVTGSSVLGFAGAGVLLVCAGLAAVWRARRRKHKH